MKKLTIGFIGLGLIGGSIAKALRNAHPEYILMAYDRSKDSLKSAIDDGIINTSADSIQDLSICNYIFLCTPVEYNSTYLEQLKTFITKETIITDVGSVKGYIHKTVEALDMEDCFIGGHPMAGSEKSGYANAAAHLLENAYYAITPTSKTPSHIIEEYSSLVKSIGAIPVVIDYETHDYSVAGISHLPHVIASSLVNVVKECDTDEETMKMLAAGGFKDITRIASSSPEMWEQICMTNTEQILKLIDNFSSNLSEFRSAISNGMSSRIYELFDGAKDYRNSINTTSKGLLSKTHVMYCDIIDEEGAIATIATILAINHISIKNIGIIHNREYEQGVLKIEVYDEASLEKADALLTKHRYTIYKN